MKDKIILNSVISFMSPIVIKKIPWLVCGPDTVPTGSVSVDATNQRLKIFGEKKF